jgi:hypothetical protein
MRRLAPLLALAFAAALLTAPAANADVTVDCNAARQPCGSPCTSSDANCWSAASVTCPPDRRLGLMLLRAQLANKEKDQELAVEAKTVAAQHARVVRQERRLHRQARLIRRLRHELGQS